MDLNFFDFFFYGLIFGSPIIFFKMAVNKYFNGKWLY